MYNYFRRLNGDFFEKPHFETRFRFISANNQGETAIEASGDEIESATKRAKPCVSTMVLNSQ
jgi:hypothetical protein